MVWGKGVGMGARLRALAILLSLLVSMAGTSLLLINASGSVGPLQERAAHRSAPRQPALFGGEVLISANGGFSGAEVRRIMSSVRVSAISAVRTGYLPVAGGSPGYEVIPAETIAVEPSAYPPAVGRAGRGLEAMLEEGVVLSRTAASLRELRVGGRLVLTKGRVLRVTGIVDDHVLGGYEAALSVERGARLGIAKVGYTLVRPRGGLDTVKTSLRRLLGARPLAFWLPGQRPWFRGGNGTLPLAQVKLRFGEFPVRSLADPVPSPSWLAANLAARSLPLLGTVRCHRLVLDDLAAAMTELERQRLTGLVDVAAVQRAGGCLGVGESDGRRGKLSASTWGIGLDLAAGGSGTSIDRRLVATMARHGFTWGGRWPQREPGRFEWMGAGA
jgi:hypothetical protein